METWKDVPGHLGYSVSDQGRVRGKRGTILKPDVTKGGYRRVSFFDAGLTLRVTVHRLVLTTFCGAASPDAPVARHLDGDSSNNRLANLQWGTKSENERDKIRHGTSNQGSGNGRAKLTEDDVRSIRQRIEMGDPQVSIARDLGIPSVTVNHISTRRTWRHVA